MNRLAYIDRASLPNVAAVYLIFSGDSCLYVGSSGKLRRRITTHTKLAEFEEHKATHIEWVECSFEELGNLENAIIKKNRPFLNSYASRSSKPPAKRGSSRFEESGEFTTFRDTTLKLLHKRRYSVSFAQISEETGIGESWLSQFSRGKIKEPSVNTIERLYAHLNGERIKV